MSMLDAGSRLGLLIILLCLVVGPYFQENSDRLTLDDASYHPNFDLEQDRTVPISIHIFAWRRKKSLERLCKSINRARFHGHRIPIYFHVDGDPRPEVVEYIQSFKWKHGSKIVNFRPKRLGMPAAIVESWNPDSGMEKESQEEFAIFLEDDNAVSRAFFEYALFCVEFIKSHRAAFEKDSGLIGCSLYTPKVNEIGPAKNPAVPPRWSAAKTVKDKSLFYFQLPCSWGAVYSSIYWNQFLEYYWNRKNLRVQPEIPDSRTNEWISSWKRMLVELMVTHGWYLLYTNLGRGASFSTNFFEVGIHSQQWGKPFFYPDRLKNRDWRFTVPLRHTLPADMNSGIYRNFTRSVLDDMPWVDLYHKQVSGRSALVAGENVRQNILSI